MESGSLSSNAAASSLPPATGTSRINVGTTERLSSVIGGMALAIYGIRNWNTISGKLSGIGGLLLLKRGVTGYCEVNNVIGRNSALKNADAIEAEAFLNVKRPRQEVYAFWRNFENLPSFMQHLDKVEVGDERRSVWTARLPGGVGTVTWEAVIEEEIPNDRISWSSLPGSTIDHAGEVRFVEGASPGDTHVTARISYRLPAGDLGSLTGKFINPLVEKMVVADLHRFARYLEGQATPAATSYSPTV